MSPALTPAELGDKLGDISEEQVLAWRRQYGWPSIKIGKTIRFTTEHVEQIIARHTSTPKRVEDSPAVVIDGQTKRSARRAS